MDKAYMFALANAVLCMGVVVISLCRLNKMTKAVLFRVRATYAVYLNCALLSALQPLWGEWPQWAALTMASALLFNLLMSSANWAGGPPRDILYPNGMRSVI